LAKTSINIELLFATPILSSFATGASFIGSTVTVTVLLLLAPLLSVALTTISTFPFAFGFGVSIKLLPSTLTSNIEGSELTALNVTSSPSVSV